MTRPRSASSSTLRLALSRPLHNARSFSGADANPEVEPVADRLEVPLPTTTAVQEVSVLAIASRTEAICQLARAAARSDPKADGRSEAISADRNHA